MSQFSIQTAKNTLQEYMSKYHLELPVYRSETVESSRFPVAFQSTVSVSLSNTDPSLDREATGPECAQKKMSQKAAALEMLKLMDAEGFIADECATPSSIRESRASQSLDRGYTSPSVSGVRPFVRSGTPGPFGVPTQRTVEQKTSLTLNGGRVTIPLNGAQPTVVVMLDPSEWEEREGLLATIERVYQEFPSISVQRLAVSLQPHSSSMVRGVHEVVLSCVDADEPISVSDILHPLLYMVQVAGEIRGLTCRHQIHPIVLILRPDVSADEMADWLGSVINSPAFPNLHLVSMGCITPGHGRESLERVTDTAERVRDILKTYQQASERF
ncbi:hypothetical protein KIPB_000529 [Kipferlia bialata]|uniref:DRBM domain-containing protein n=1 Tax=Kipferlia bialata TaxID=797122 RepID=A0A9K3GDJ2_9EUKA|nr:hypothetical protein KIPB_000529 [Kipferlia bialata]|eukprot:g529.t1